jgi:hypothetical protein
VLLVTPREVYARRRTLFTALFTALNVQACLIGLPVRARAQPGLRLMGLR